MSLPFHKSNVSISLLTCDMSSLYSQNSFKLWASNRFLFFWGEFLRHPDAPRDPQHTAIKSMYETATSSVRNTGSGSGSGGSKGAKENGKKSAGGKKAKKPKA